MSVQDLTKIVKESTIEEIMELIPTMQKMPVVEVGEILEEVDDALIFRVLDGFSREQQGLIFSEFSISKQVDLFNAVSQKRFGELFETIPSDIRADLFQELSQRDQTALLPYLSKKVRENVLSLSRYSPDTAGGIMSTDFATVQSEMTCAEAIAKVRSDAPSKKTIYYIYVVDDDQKLLGFITLKSLIMADPNIKVGAALNSEFIFAYVDDDQEQVAQQIEKYDLVAIPILNREHQLVGIVTHDDAIEVIRAEHSEEMQKFMGIARASEEFDYMGDNTIDHFQKRIVWMISLALLGLVSGIIIHKYEGVLEKLTILALYVPMIADAGGNAGSQSATVVIRALALGQVTVGNWLTILWKEARIAVLVALSVGLIAYGKVYFLSWEANIPDQYSLQMIAITITLALCLQVISSTVIGAGLPLLVKRFGQDPAVAASPAITTVVDVTGLLIYFTCASYILSI